MQFTFGRHLAIIAISLGLATCARAPSHDQTSALPASCRTACVSAYGTTLGGAQNGIPAYSNCKAGCFVYAKNYYQNTYTGIQWQCVEYARRWLLINHNMVYGDVDIAADIWNKIDFYTRVTDQAKIKTVNYANGAADPPQAGDLLIYAKELLGTGHVAVVTNVDTSTQTLKVAEQNFNNQPWPGAYARSIAFEQRNHGVWVKDDHLLGWKRAEPALH